MRTRRSPRLLLAVVLAGLSLPLSGAHATEDPSPSPTAGPNDDAPAQVLVTKLAPRAPTDPEEFFQVRGTITNRGSQPLSDVRVRLRRGEVLQSRSELAVADSEEPATTTLVGTRVPAEDETLDPGETTTFDLRLRVGLLRMRSLGVYPLRVEVRARFGDEGIGAVGGAQTLVPWFPEPPRGRTRIAWLWPLVDQPRRGPREVMVDDQLAREVAPQGRLDTLLRAAAEGQKGRCDDLAQGPADAAPRPPSGPCRAESVPVTYAIDPDLAFDVDAMTSPYQLRVTADRVRQVRNTADVRTWLETLRSATSAGGTEVLALPYADPDVVALTDPDSGLADEVGRLRSLGASEVERVVGRRPLSSVVWPPAGRLTRTALESLSAGAQAAVLDPVALAERDTDSGRTPDAHVGQLGQPTGGAVNGLTVDTVLSDLVTRGYDDFPGARLAEQRWIAETAIIAAEAPSVSRTLVVAPARRGEVIAAVGAALLADTGRLPWLCPVSLASVAVGTDACLGETTPEPRDVAPAELEPVRAGETRLSPRFLREVSSARRAAAQFTDDVLEPGPDAVRTTARLLRARARTVSSAWRDNAPDGEEMLDLLQDDLADLRGKVHLEVGGGTVTLTSRTGVISVNVVNELGQPVRVGVQLTPGARARLSLSEVPVETVPPGRSTQINLRVTSATSGKFAVTALLVDRSRRPFGNEVELVVRSTQYGRVALAVTGVAAGVLLVAAGVRITRRALRRGRPA